MVNIDTPAVKANLVTPSDTVALSPIPGAIYVGVSGDITMELSGDSAAVLFKSVPVGILHVRPKLIKATGTTATNILALY